MPANQNPKETILPATYARALALKDIKTGIRCAPFTSLYCLNRWISRSLSSGIAIEPKTQADVDKLSIALNKLAEEDPTFQVRTDPTAADCH